MPTISKLYTPGNGPNPTNAKLPMLGDCVQWDHRETWHVPKYTASQNGTSNGTGYGVEVDISQEKDAYLKDHVIDGRILYPAAGYLVMAWEAIAKQCNVGRAELDVVIKDVKIHESTVLTGEEKVTFQVQIIQSSGRFEITEGENLKCSGIVKKSNGQNTSQSEVIVKENMQSLKLDKTGLYQELRLRGYDYGPRFQSVQLYNMTEKFGSVSHKNNWVAFLDALMHVMIVEEHTERALRVPTRIQELCITPSRLTIDSKDIDMRYDKRLLEVKCNVASMRGVTVTTLTRNTNINQPTLNEYRFESYFNENGVSNDIKPIEADDNCTKGATIQTGAKINKDTEPNNINTVYVNTYNTGHNPSGTGPDTKMEADLSQEDATELKKHLKILYEIFIENTFKQRMVIGAKITTVDGIETLKQLFEITSAFSIFQVQFWVVNTDVIMESQINKTHAGDARFIRETELNNSLIESTDLIVYESGSAFEGDPVLSKMMDRSMILLQTAQSVASQIVDNQKLQDRPIHVIARRDLNDTSFMLLRSPLKSKLIPHVIHVESDDFEWVPVLRQKLAEIAEKPNDRIWLVVTQNKATGLVGFVNCLFQESKVKQLRCLVNVSLKTTNIPKDLLPGNPKFNDLVQRDVLMNVYKDGVFGSYRRTQFLKNQATNQLNDVFLDIPIKGDLSSLSWVEMPPKDPIQSNKTIRITHAALNFRDVMIASGRIPIDTVAEGARNSDSILGLEFAGFDKQGKRYFGTSIGMTFATTIPKMPYRTWPVPPNWTLAEAVTVGMAYSTAYYSLILRGNMKPGDRVLIHSATSGVGQAALRLSLAMGCDVFVTAGTQTKRHFLATECGIQLDHIANSRDLSFVGKFLDVTDGEGMDIVLNSLADEKFMAGFDLVADNGTFLEIGKYDLFEDTKLGLAVFLKNISFHGIQIERIFCEGNPDLARVHKMIEEGIANNVVKPLKYRLFQRRDVESAFRYMAEGEHIGKIVVQMQDTDDDMIAKEAFQVQTYDGLRRSYFHPNKIYIITGGLGGMGLELANWLIQRGANNLILTSRSGVTTDYQRYVMHRWKTQGANVVISKRDVRKEQDTKLMIEEALALGPVGGVFHLAAVIHDCLFEMQTPETFQKVCDIKAKGIDNLDYFTRELCGKTLDHFVAFSSVSAGIGNAGQSNYGFANTYMERVCEARVRDGYPAKAIQWGYIGDVGIVQNTLDGNDQFTQNMIIQRIPSFLETLDLFLVSDVTICASMVLQPHTKSHDRSEDTADQAVEAIAKIIGAKDISRIKTTTPLVEMGLDSLMGTEIRQVFARRFDLQLSVAEVQNLTLDGVKTLFGQ